MKKIALIAAFSLLVATAFAQDGKSIYNKYSDEKNVSAVYISPTMFRLMGSIPEIEMRRPVILVASTFAETSV